MVGADEYTELWWPPNSAVLFVRDLLTTLVIYQY